MNNTLVSVVISIYNVENYATKAIETSIKQTYPNIEIILVDDGSTDGSGALCNQFAEKDRRIKVIHKENGGLSSARNAGAEAAAGEYIMFLDGDDYLRLDAVERLVDVLARRPSDMIQFEYTEVDANEKQINAADSITDTDRSIRGASTPAEFFNELYRKGGVYASGCTKLFKKELIQQIPFQNILHEDEMWCTEAFQHNMSVTYISDVLYYYVMRDNSIIHSSFNRSKLDSFHSSEARISVLEKLGLNELASVEYSKLFGTILTLHYSAKSAGDKEALKLIRHEFNKHKKAISLFGGLKGKFKLLFNLMIWCYPSVNLYGLYLKIHGKRF